MLTLRELQVGFRQSIAGEAAGTLLELIAGDGFDPADRLGFYRNNVITRLIDSLSATYPVVSQLVDPRFFSYAATEFIGRHLPAGGCLGEYGAEFPAFLAGFAPASELRYLADVAKLEWAIHEVRRAATSPPMPIAALTGMRGDPAQAKLRIKAAARFLSAPYAIDQIWIAHQPDRTWSGLAVSDVRVWLQVEGAAVLRITPLAPSTWAFRDQIARGASLGEAIASALAISPRFDPATALSALFAEELVTGLTQGDEKWTT